MTTDNYNNKIIEADPAKYPLTSIPESDSIAIFKNIIDRKHIKTHDLKEMDKVPNFDGTIEITKEDQTPIGKLDVQIKKLSERYVKSPKYQCSLELLSACDNSIIPVLLIVVDTKNEVGYWKLMDRDFLKTLKPKAKAKSTNVDIPKSNIIKKGEVEYVNKWIKIVEDYRKKLHLSEYFIQENKKLQETINILTTKTEETLGEENEGFVEIHKFLDTLNYELDANYSVIKDIYYQSAWKLGFAYAVYENNSVAYSLYPINYNKNDLQIKRISKESMNEFAQNGFTIHFQENPFKIGSTEYTKKWIIDKLKPLFEKKVFPIKDPILARELIFSYIDLFNKDQNIKSKDTYKIDEIKGYIGNLSPNSMRYSGISLNILRGIIEYLEELKIKDLDRFYLPKDYSNVSNYIWEVWSTDDVKVNIQRFFKEYPYVHDNFLKLYFPSFVDHFKYFNSFDRVIFLVDVKEKYESWQNGPIIERIFLKNKNNDEERIDVFISGEQHPLSGDNHPLNHGRPDLNKTIIIEDEEYLLKSIGKGILDFIYEDSPMLEYLYKQLLQKFETFLFRNKYSGQ